MMELTPEQVEWMRRVAPLQGKPERRTKTSKPDPVPVLTDAEIAWLWPRFQNCSHRGYSFAKSFAKTGLDHLTARGRAVVHSVAYPYRRQIFRDSAKWSEARFISEVRQAAGKEGA